MKRAAGSRHSRHETSLTDVAALEACDLRIDEQPYRRRERRALGGFRQTGNAERTADPDIAAEHAAGGLGQAGELAGTPGEHDTLADRIAVTGLGEAVADQLQRLVDAG